MVKHIHVPIPNQRSESATSHVIEEGAVRTALTLYEQRLCNVTIEIGSPETMGMTIVDWWHVTNKRKNCTMLRSMDADPFFALMLERIGSLA